MIKRWTPCYLCGRKHCFDARQHRIDGNTLEWDLEWEEHRGQGLGGVLDHRL